MKSEVDTVETSRMLDTVHTFIHSIQHTPKSAKQQMSNQMRMGSRVFVQSQDQSSPMLYSHGNPPISSPMLMFKLLHNSSDVTSRSMERTFQPTAPSGFASFPAFGSKGLEGS